MGSTDMGGGLLKRRVKITAKGNEKKPKRAFDVAINITPMTDLMASILCFLLVSATYVSLAKLDANLPSTGGSGAAQAQTDLTEEEQFSLQLLLTKDSSIKIDRGQGLEDVPAAEGGSYDWVKLDEVLKAVKAEHPGHQEAVLSADPDVDYEHIIAAMDVSIANKFPNVSLAASAAKGAE